MLLPGTPALQPTLVYDTFRPTSASTELCHNVLQSWTTFVKHRTVSNEKDHVVYRPVALSLSRTMNNVPGDVTADDR